MQRRKQNAAISLAVIDAHCHAMGTPVLALVVNNPPANAGSIRDAVSIPGSGRSPGEENGYPLQCSCLGNPMDRGAWQAIVHGVTKQLDMT